MSGKTLKTDCGVYSIIDQVLLLKISILTLNSNPNAHYKFIILFLRMLKDALLKYQSKPNKCFWVFYANMLYFRLGKKEKMMMWFKEGKVVGGKNCYLLQFSNVCFLFSCFFPWSTFHSYSYKTIYGFLKRVVM